MKLLWKGVLRCGEAVRLQIFYAGYGFWKVWFGEESMRMNEFENLLKLGSSCVLNARVQLRVS